MTSIERAAQRLAEAAGTQDTRLPKAVEPRQESSAARTTGVASQECEIDLAALKERGFLTPGLEISTIAEEYREIKRPVLMNAFGKNAGALEHGNVVMVTSALPGEGKSFTAMNLAMSIAMERDTTVLLVDGDVVRGSLSNMLGLTQRPGLIDVLDNPNVGLGDVILRTNVPGLRVIPSGVGHAHSTELLSSVQMAAVVNELAQRYSDRLVIFDSPPMLLTSQARVLSGLMGQVLVVVEEGQTPRGAVVEAVSQLDSAKPIGMVLNKSRKPSHGGYYYGGYYGSYQ